MGNVIVKYCVESDYFNGFDRETGFFFRSRKDGSDPFCNIAGPELLDISITNYCDKGCAFCYRSSGPDGRHMPLGDYAGLIAQAANAGVLQVALGGGNPNQHPEFTDILRLTRESGIVPSYTTNGLGMTPEIYAATKKYCGAMAVSWYEPRSVALEALRQAGEHGIRANIHFLLSASSLPGAIGLLESGDGLLKGVNAVVFLNYKPVRPGGGERLSDGPEVKRFLELAGGFKGSKIGFDSCMISYLPLLGEDLARESVDFCEAGRFSAFVSEDMRLYPCSFMCGSGCEGEDLKARSLADAWRNGEDFVGMRSKLKTPGCQDHPLERCAGCGDYDMCRGGCQIFDINRCREGTGPQAGAG
jgi:radical SAM protein with 4Fe4S-binding SPASM domain